MGSGCFSLYPEMTKPRGLENTGTPHFIPPDSKAHLRTLFSDPNLELRPSLLGL